MYHPPPARAHSTRPRVMGLAIASLLAASALPAQAPEEQRRVTRGRPTTATLSPDTRVYDVTSANGTRELETVVRRRDGLEWIVELSGLASTTELRFDTLFNMRLYRHTGAGIAETEVRSDGGRLRGRAPDANGRSRTVDAAPPGLAGPRMLWLALLESMQEVPASFINVPELDLASDEAPRTRALQIVGREPVTVPAGTFSAIRIDTDDGATYWLREGGAHVLLKLEIPAPAGLGGGTPAAGGSRRRYELRSLAVSGAGSPPAGGDVAEDVAVPLLSLTDSLFEVHAPDSASLAIAARGARRASAHFHRLFHEAPARFATVLYDTDAQRRAHHDLRYRERGLHVQRWAARQAVPWLSSSRGAAPPTLNAVSEAFLAHETVHQLVNHRVGTLPAWFSEGVASLVETKEELEPQQAALRRGVQELIPLTELFASGHPASVGSIVSKQSGSGDGGVTMAVTTSDPATTRRLLLFYPQSRAIVEYLIEREGGDVIRRLAQGLSAGQSMASLLAQLHHVPNDIPAFEHAWREWLVARIK